MVKRAKNYSPNSAVFIHFSSHDLVHQSAKSQFGLLQLSDSKTRVQTFPDVRRYDFIRAAHTRSTVESVCQQDVNVRKEAVIRRTQGAVCRQQNKEQTRDSGGRPLCNQSSSQCLLKRSSEDVWLPARVTRTVHELANKLSVP